MKKCVSVLLLIVFSIFSCDQKEKYQGKWIDNYYHNSSFDEYIPAYFLIEEDSIKFNYGPFNHWHNYKLEIKRDKLVFNNNETITSIDIDTLSLNNRYQYVKSTNDSLQFFEHETPILDIELPQIEGVSTLGIDNTSPSFYIYFGKRLDNGKYSLQLNDKYGDIYDLRAFTNNRSCSGSRDELLSFPTIYLFIEGTTPLRYIDQIFSELIMSNNLKTGLINNINLNQNHNKLSYDFEILIKKLPSFQFDKDYRSQINTKGMLQPPQPPPPLPYLDIDQSKSDYVFLMKNEMFYKKAKINTVELKEIIEKSIKNNHTIFSLYDLESNYGSFLEMNTIIDNTYKEKREQKSKLKYNKSIKDLTKDEIIEVYLEIPMKHFWSYSISHYQAIIKNENSIFGTNLKSIDSLLPKNY